MDVIQVLREWPPGYGGVERVAHELANVWGGTVYSLDVQRQAAIDHDPLPVGYPRFRLRSIKLFGRLQLPLPSLSLLRLLLSSVPLHGHLPSPGVLLLLVMARLLRPRRPVTAHWHCFLEPGSGINGRLFLLYQSIALRLIPWFSAVVTTSHPRAGVRILAVHPVGCSYSHVVLATAREAVFGISCASTLWRTAASAVLGRLDCYKRLDWLLEALAQLTSPWQLVVVGDGPKRPIFEKMAQSLFPQASPVRFLGRLSEFSKGKQLAKADLLVLPSDCSNEAFGIVQLEAMAAGRISLAFDLPRSGMSWVGRLPGLLWSQSPEGLAEVLQRLADQPALRQKLCEQARQRYCKLFARRVWLHKLQQLGDLTESGMVCNAAE